MEEEGVRKLLGRFDRLIFDPQIDKYLGKLQRINDLDQIVLLNNQFLYLTHLKEKRISYVSDNLIHVLGYNRREFSLPFFFKIIHPDDKNDVYSLLAKLLELSNTIKVRPFEYTLSIDFRVKHKSGEYLRLLRQTSVFKNDKLGHPVLLLNICSDISHLSKKDKVDFVINGKNKTKLNQIIGNMKEPEMNLSKREKDIAKYLVQGKSSKDISELLFISKNTVDTHRRNMLEKTKRKNTTELVAYCLDKGLL